MTQRSPVVSASHYYLVMTVKNLAFQALRGLGSPRNLLAVAVAILFGLLIWFMVSRAPAAAAGRPHELADTLRERFIALHAIAILVSFDVVFRCTALLFDSGVSTLARLLAFKRADVEFLFRAPVTRRQIVYFKVTALLAQTCVGAAVYASLLAFIYPGISFPRAFLGLALGVNAIQMIYLALHLGASFLASRNLRYLVFVISAAGMAALSYGLVQAFIQSHVLFGELSRIAATPAFQALVLPLEFVLAPAVAESWQQFLRTLWQPLIVGALAGTVFFTRRFHFAYFEEAFGNREPDAEHQEDAPPSAAASQPTAAERRRPDLLRLGRVGPQWRAIAWKNLKSCVPRSSGSARVQAVLALLVVAVFCLAPLSEGYQIIVSTLLYTVIVSAVVVGPWVMRRGGLRSDISHFDMLKSMPISGRQLLFGEVVVQLAMIGGVVLLAVAILALRGRGPSIGFLLALLGLIAARVTIHNLFALYFPGFVKLDPAGSENDHRILVRGAVSVLALAVLLIVPVLAAGAIATIGGRTLHLDRVVLGNVVSACIGILLVLELLALIYCSESRYQRLDISRENTTR
jgi:ABC-2 type transport system permease protein